MPTPMPRKKITAPTAKKARQQLKRAIKRGDAEAPEPTGETKRRARRAGPRPARGALNQNQKQAAATDSAKRLQSSFVKISPDFVKTTRDLAASLVLPRPVPSHAAVFDETQWGDAPSSSRRPLLTCPRRPEWTTDMSKEVVEANEERAFHEWLQETDRVVEEWEKDDQPSTSDEDDLDHDHDQDRMPRSTTYFERNLEVWRQFWRVTEMSDILLVLVDSRCPILHYPPSLASYLANRKVILVLTKVDIIGPARAAAWETYFKTRYPLTPVVQVESYRQRESSAHQGGKQFERHMSQTFRDKLVDAIQRVHELCLESNTRPEDGKSAVRTRIDWDAVRVAMGEKVGTIVGESSAPKPDSDQDGQSAGPSERRNEPEFLTIGLIGQPNVGKSSLLNALFGSSRVRVSKTPGKTKHFQTLFWTSDVRLVDCPGLVLPNLVPIETQIMLGIFPISRVNAIPSSIYHASLLIPFEEILQLKHPDADLPVPEDKRTYRDGLPRPARVREIRWSAMDILTAHADRQGYVTAQAGRSDVNRAGNALLRGLAEGRIPWGFWPSGVELPVEASTAHGIFIAGGKLAHDLDEYDDDGHVEAGNEPGEGDSAGSSSAEGEEDESEDTSSDAEEDESDEGDEALSSRDGSGIPSRFSMLALDEASGDAQQLPRHQSP